MPRANQGLGQRHGILDGMKAASAWAVAVLLAASASATGGCGRASFDPAGSSNPAREAVLDAFTTGSTSFVEVPVSLTFGSSDRDESWLVLLSASLGGEAGIGFRPTTQVRYLIDGVERGLGEGASVSPGANAWQHFDYVTTPGEHTVRVEARSVSEVAVDAGLADLHIVALPLSRLADPHFQELSTEVMPIGDYVDAMVLPVTPPAPGDYLVLALLVGTEAPSQGVLRARIRDPGDAEWPAGRELSNNQPVWHSLFLARRQALDLAPAAFSLELEGSQTVPATARDLRMLAFRTDAFASADSVADLEPSSTTSAEPVVKSRLEVSEPPSRRTYLAIQSMMVYDPLEADTLMTRGLRFSSTENEPLEYLYEVENHEQRLSFGRAYLVDTADPGVYENAFFSPGSAEVVASESVIHVLGLDP